MQAGRQACVHAGILACRHAGRHAGRQAGGQAGRHACMHACIRVGRQTSTLLFTFT